MWTQFWDMHSGGGAKEAPYEKIYIEAPLNEASVIFYNRFGHNPERVSCTCCGEDYTTDENESLEQLTGFHRGCKSGYMIDGELKSDDWWYKQTLEERKKASGKFVYVEQESEKRFSFNSYMTLDEYLARQDVLAIYDKDIKPEERVGEVPPQGYIWCD